ncbi:NAD-dependent epimerase/dehydratase family protein [Chryseobacterium gossypii]|uniref:NAD-dependent epimerase/dehydratase family protein n=1 Tax=Chryseobacterium gossypii TaxID=3231602 RepID=UPI0035244689
MKKVFITGITGLLGYNVLLKLLNDGYSVIALVRKKSRYVGQENENLKLVEGDLFTDISPFLENVEYIIHVAAETGQNLPDYESYRKINYHAVVHLFSQAVSSGVKKFLFISSANTLGYGSLEKPGHENKPQKYPFTHSFYAKSKLEAEDYLLQAKTATEVIILNPCFMIGAYDNKPSSGKIIFWTWKKKLVFYPRGGKNFVHAEDVAEGIVKALKKGKNGEKYLLGHENLRYIDFFRKVNAITGQNPVMVPVPDWILIFLGIIGDGLRMMKIKTGISSAHMKALRTDNFYSGQKSVEELEIRYQPVEKAINDAIEYFRSMGH